MMLCGSRLLVDCIRASNKQQRLPFFFGRGAAAAAAADSSDGEGSPELSSSSSGPSSAPSSGGGSSSKQQMQKASSSNSNQKRNRPPVLSKLSAILARFRTFVRSKLMLKINGRPVLKLTGWHASVAVLLAGFLLTSLLGGAFGGAGGGASGPTEVPYSDFMKLVKDHGPEVVSRVRVAPDRFDFLLNGAPSFTRPVKAHPSLLFFLDKYNVPFYAGKQVCVGKILNYVWLGCGACNIRGPCNHSISPTRPTKPTQAPPPPNPWQPSWSSTSCPSPGSSSPWGWGASSTGT